MSSAFGSTPCGARAGASLLARGAVEHLPLVGAARDEPVDLDLPRLPDAVAPGLRLRRPSRTPRSDRSAARPRERADESKAARSGRQPEPRAVARFACGPPLRARTCRSFCGFQSESKMMTVSAAVRLMPTPPALVQMRNANRWSPGSLNRSMALCGAARRIGAGGSEEHGRARPPSGAGAAGFVGRSGPTRRALQKRACPGGPHLSRRAADAAVDALDRKALPPHVVLEDVEHLPTESSEWLDQTCSNGSIGPFRSARDRSGGGRPAGGQATASQAGRGPE